MGRPRRLPACKASGATQDRWCRACKGKKGVDQCEGPDVETAQALPQTVRWPRSTLHACAPATALCLQPRTIRRPRICQQCSRPCWLEVCALCLLEKTLMPLPTPPRPPRSSDLPMTSSGRVVKPPQQVPFLPDQVYCTMQWQACFQWQSIGEKREVLKNSETQHAWHPAWRASRDLGQAMAAPKAIWR